MTRDNRPRILAEALYADDLTYAEKSYMAIVATIRPEYIDGERRHGSRAMGGDGQYSLHLDYLAGALGASPEAVRKIQRSLKAKRYLDLVAEGTFGRPSQWHALLVRGAKNGRVTSRRNGTPYGLAEWVTRGAESAPLTYKTPDHPDQAPTSGASPKASGHRDKRSKGEVGGPEVVPHPQVDAGPCQYHGFTRCDDDCADHPAHRERSA